MSKIDVSEDEFVALCNRELRKHDLYEKGMEIINVPEGSSGKDSSGYGWKGPERTRGIVADVVTTINKEYTLGVT